MPTFVVLYACTYCIEIQGQIINGLAGQVLRVQPTGCGFVLWTLSDNGTFTGQTVRSTMLMEDLTFYLDGIPIGSELINFESAPCTGTQTVILTVGETPMPNCTTIGGHVNGGTIGQVLSVQPNGTINPIEWILDANGDFSQQEVNGNSSQEMLTFYLDGTAIGQRLINFSQCPSTLLFDLQLDINETTNHTLDYTYTITGYDTFSTPIDIGTINASEMEQLFGNDNIDMISYYDEITQSYISYSFILADFGIPQPDFTIQPGRGYMIYVSTPTQFTLQGPEVNTPINLLGGGYNLVGYNSLTDSTAVNSFIANCHNDSIDMVSKWNATTQNWETYSVILAGFGIPQTDFPTTPGKAYYIYANTNDQIYT
jgi:hypothetical protein